MDLTITKNTIAVFLVTFFSQILADWATWYLISLSFVLGDLVMGIHAARYRGERIRFSKAGRRTIAKMIEYLCLTLITIIVANICDVEWVKPAVFYLIFAFEGSSILSNFFAARGYDLQLNLFSILGKIFSKRFGITDLAGLITLTKHESEDDDNETQRIYKFKDPSGR